MRKPVDSNSPTMRLVRQEPAGYLTHANSLETLERRLNDGYDRIELARARGENVDAWEEFWIDLLHQYEAAHDALPEAA